MNVSIQPKTILYEKRAFVAEITLDRPGSKNAIPPGMIADLSDIYRDLCEDSDMRVVVIKGEGDHAFSGRADTGLPGAGSIDEIERFSAASIVAMIEIPTLAAINGDAIGQGLELALACDLRICSDSARFVMHQVIRGEIPWDGGTQRLARLVGRGKALEIILLVERIDAK